MIKIVKNNDQYTVTFSNSIDVTADIDTVIIIAKTLICHFCDDYDSNDQSSCQIDVTDILRPIRNICIGDNICHTDGFFVYDLRNDGHNEYNYDEHKYISFDNESLYKHISSGIDISKR